MTRVLLRKRGQYLGINNIISILQSSSAITSTLLYLVPCSVRPLLSPLESKQPSILNSTTKPKKPPIHTL
ncbi:hypothetical protein M747DRAFT_299498 [Aspergillus niger ATCC 13496]|uniref:Uncharacterized protein n=1 Tax=Aspergillus niger ATCC 13496 TaxID=1353008 RepID=A0A370BQC2_ASPNG|nr:hypothetical protein M747DRAFT_299498 [Aspergillus niger ATCC 13496]